MDIIEIIRLLKGNKKNLVDVSLGFVRYEIGDTLTDVARIHLFSAEQAFIAAFTSTAPELEIRVGIGHLRDSFNAYQILLEKGGVWILSFSDEFKTSMQLKLASVAIVISLIYKNLGDLNNYLDWKITALNYAKLYLQNRPLAIKKWKTATKGPGILYPRLIQLVLLVDDSEKQENYRKEMIFIDAFSKLVEKEL